MAPPGFSLPCRPNPFSAIVGSQDPTYHAQTADRVAHAVLRVAGALAALAACALVGGFAHPTPVSAGTSTLFLTVNRTSDEHDANTADPACDVDLGTSGSQCTLRAAIEQANANLGSDPDFIHFDIPGQGAHQIAPSGYLPDITGLTIIDGYTQPGASPNTKKLGRGDNAAIEIVLSGRKLNPLTGSGLTLATGAGGSVVKGLAVNRFSNGIEVNVPATIAGDFIGTDATGTRDRGNRFDGIHTTTFPGTLTIGGPAPAARNVISANGAGVTSAAQPTIQGNYIGTASDGRSPLGNKTWTYDDAAILLGSESSFSTVGGAGNAANVIAFNRGKGIAVISPGTVALLRRNRIFGNHRIAIDLGDDGRTPNDVGDTDMGPNGLLNFPILRHATARRRHTKITGVYKSYQGVAPYGIELFANSPHTHQAKRFIGSVHIDTDASGKATFRLTTNGRIGPGHTITATATDDGAETSEVSHPIRVKSASPPAASAKRQAPASGWRQRARLRA